MDSICNITKYTNIRKRTKHPNQTTNSYYSCRTTESTRKKQRRNLYLSSNYTTRRYHTNSNHSQRIFHYSKYSRIPTQLTTSSRTNLGYFYLKILIDDYSTEVPTNINNSNNNILYLNNINITTYNVQGLNDKLKLQL